MKRYVDINDISDGKKYTANDLVKAGCQDCKGCHDCCTKVADTIQLDPLDIWRLTTGTGKSMEQLLMGAVAFGAADGIVLPHMKMDEHTDACSFLDENGRCSIHPHRPGICRLFPLGRAYEDNGFYYFLQTEECKKKDRVKVKVKKWLDTPQLNQYEAFVLKWHNYIAMMKQNMQQWDDQTKNEENVFLLKLFYLMPYEASDFYPQFEERLSIAMQRSLTNKIN